MQGGPSNPPESTGGSDGSITTCLYTTLNANAAGKTRFFLRISEYSPTIRCPQCGGEAKQVILRGHGASLRDMAGVAGRKPGGQRD